MRRPRQLAVVPVLAAALLGVTPDSTVLAKPTPKVERARVRFPTFQVAGGGGGVLSLRVSKTTELSESSSKGHYVLRVKNARIAVRNDAHVLHAEHFDSTVLEARLKSAGADVLFDVSLRADVAPVKNVRPVTAEERAEEPHKEASPDEVVITLEFPSAPAKP